LIRTPFCDLIGIDLPIVHAAAGLVREIKPAADIVHELIADAERFFREGSRLAG
jgi:hypothetical protein